MINSTLIAKHALQSLSADKKPPTPDHYAQYYKLAAFKLGVFDSTTNESGEDIVKLLDRQQTLVQSIIKLVKMFISNVLILHPDDKVIGRQIEFLDACLEPPVDLQTLKASIQLLEQMLPCGVTIDLQKQQNTLDSMHERFVHEMHDSRNLAKSAASIMSKAHNDLLDLDIEHEVDVQSLHTLTQNLMLQTQNMHTRMDEKVQELENTQEQVRISQQHILQLRAQLLNATKEAQQDFLTGLFNRRGLQQELEVLLAKQVAVSMAVLDIDNFKELNDVFGHSAGDKVIAGIGQCIKELFGDDHNVFSARLGGEEFVLVFEALNVQTVKTQVEKLQRLLTQKFFFETQGSRMITFSAGVVQRMAGDTVELLLDRADEVMYKAKRSGKNKVLIYEN